MVEIIIGTIPFLIGDLIVVALMMIFPIIILFLPQTMPTVR